jgi:hypothetical protein
MNTRYEKVRLRLFLYSGALSGGGQKIRKGRKRKERPGKI